LARTLALQKKRRCWNTSRLYDGSAAALLPRRA
jgi:hypothetical protein